MIESGKSHIREQSKNKIGETQMYFVFSSIKAIPFGVADAKGNKKLVVANWLEGARRKTDI